MQNTDFTAIGKRIAEIRKANNVTQEKVSEYLNISPKHVSHVERGVSSFSIKNLMDFCILFHCSLDYILFGKSEDSVLAKLPEEITDILYKGSPKDIDRLNHYLETYIELTRGQD